MGLFDQWPYTNFHELNLTWILQALKEIQTTTQQFVAINSLKYADPIQWNIVRQYEKNTIVIDPLTGTAYISVQPVPTGVALTNEDYWTVVFDLGSFVTRAAKNFTTRYEEGSTTTATFNTAAGQWVVWGDTLYKANVNITAGDSYVIGGNIQRITVEEIKNEIYSIIGDLTQLSTTNKDNVVAAINEIVTAITNAVSNLQDAINLEAQARATADSNLQTAIDNEAQTRATADSSLQTAIDNEAQTRNSADTQLQTNIDNLINGTTPFTMLNAPGTLKFPAANVYSRYFKTLPYQDPDGNTVNLLAANSDIDLIGSGMYINVMLYGADNTGTEDSTAAIQNAIDYAESLPTGGVVYIPAGTYIITDTLRLKSRVSILGDGMRESLLRFTNSSTRVGIDAHSIDIRGQVIKGIALIRDTKDTGSPGTYPDWTKYAAILCGSQFTEYNSAIFTIQNVFIQNFYTGVSGTYYHGVANGIGLFDSHLIDVWIDNTQAAATILGGSGNKYDHLRITNCGSGFMFCRISDESFDGGTIIGCIVISSAGYDITFRDAGYYRPIDIIGTWFEQSAVGIVNMPYSTQLMTLSMFGNMFNSNSTQYELMTMTNCTKGVIEIFNCTFYSTASGQNQNVVMPTTTTQCKGVIRDSVKIAPDGTVTIFDQGT